MNIVEYMNINTDYIYISIINIVGTIIVQTKIDFWRKIGPSLYFENWYVININYETRIKRKNMILHVILSLWT